MNANGNKTLKVGMKVRYSTVFGGGPSKVATVEGIELCQHEHEKDGEAVNEVSVTKLCRCVLSLSDEQWAYGTQVDEIVG